MPKQAKIKREYRGDRVDALRTAEELDGAFVKHNKLHRQKDKIAVEFDRSRMQEEIHEQNFDEQMRQFRKYEYQLDTSEQEVI